MRLAKSLKLDTLSPFFYYELLLLPIGGLHGFTEYLEEMAFIIAAIFSAIQLLVYKQQLSGQATWLPPSILQYRLYHEDIANCQKNFKFRE